MSYDSTDYANEVDDFGVIYRDFELPRSGKSVLGVFMQDLLSVNGQITCMGQIGTWLPSQQRYVSTFFRLRFRSSDHLDRFHGMGYNTTKPERISLNMESTDD